jgi:hypothetical protein
MLDLKSVSSAGSAFDSLLMPMKNKKHALLSPLMPLSPVKPLDTASPQKHRKLVSNFADVLS